MEYIYFFFASAFSATLMCFLSDRTSVPGLQRTVHVGHGVRHDDLPSGVHVSRDTSASHVHELRGAAAARPDALRDRNTRVLPTVQEELQDARRYLVGGLG